MTSTWHNVVADQESDLLRMTVKVMTAYLSRNAVPLGDFPRLIAQIHTALAGIGGGDPAEGIAVPKKPKPAVSPGRSVTADYIICLEDGLKFKSLRRHLMVEFGMTPDQYRQKWCLAPSYPMVAPNYTVVRSRLVKETGFGLRRQSGV